VNTDLRSARGTQLSTRGIILVVSATAVLSLLVLAAGIYAVGMLILVPAINRTVQAAVPADLPVYPGTVYRTGSVATSDCTWLEVEWYSGDRPDKVLEFYNDKLASEPWQIVGVDDTTVTFHGGRRTELWARLTVLPEGGGSRIRLSGHTTIDAFGQRSPVCDQLYPRGTPKPVASQASP